jgi:hypothetical protein
MEGVSGKCSGIGANAGRVRGDGKACVYSLVFGLLAGNPNVDATVQSQLA